MREIDIELWIDAPRDLVFDLFVDPATFVTIIKALDNARREGDTIRWAVTGPLGIAIEGAADLVEETPPDRVAWESTEGPFEVRGYAEFDDVEGGTGVRYRMGYELPARAVLLGVADTEGPMRKTLERFKAHAELRAADTAA